MRISDWSSDVCSSDLDGEEGGIASALFSLTGASCRQPLPPKLPPDIASLSEQAAGPRMTMNSTGRMNRISGTVMIAGRRAAFSSARIMRSLRDRKSVVEGKRVAVRDNLGGGRLMNKKKKKY